MLIVVPPSLNILGSEEACVKMLQDVRWSEGIFCPHCQSRKGIHWGRYKRVYQRYWCKGCLRTFNDKTGTPRFQASLPARMVWLLLMTFYGHILQRRKGKMLGVSETTAFRYGKGLLKRAKGRQRRQGGCYKVWWK